MPIRTHPQDMSGALTDAELDAPTVVSPPEAEGVVPVIVCTVTCGTSEATFRYETPSSGGGPQPGRSPKRRR